MHLYTAPENQGGERGGDTEIDKEREGGVSQTEEREAQTERNNERK